MSISVADLRSSFLVVAAGTILKALLTFTLNKVTALGLGAAQFSEYGQYYVALTFLYTAASLGLANAHTVYVASGLHSDLGVREGGVDRKELAYLVAVLGGVFVGILASGSLLVGGGRINFLPEFPFWFALLILLYCLAVPLGVAMVAVCAAEQRYRRQQAVSTGISAISVILMTCLWLSGEMRPATAAAAYCAGFFLPVLLLGSLSTRPKSIQKTDFMDAIGFYRPFVLPGIAGSLVASAATITVLGIVKTQLPHGLSGTWFGIWRLSEAYNGLVLAVASALCLPRMARASKNLGREIVRSFILMALLYAPLMILLLFFPEWTMSLFFSREFSENLPNLWPQVAGDLLKLFCAAHILALSAISAPKWILLAEVVFATAFIFGVSVMIPSEGMSDVLLAYSGSYLLLSMILVLVFRKFFADRYLILKA